MSRRTRNLTLGAVVLLLVAVEVGYQRSRGRRACVVVTNLCPEPIEGLQVACGSDSSRVGHLGPGESARVYLVGGGNQTITLTYRQKGNSLQGFQVSGFDLAEMSRERSRLVLNIRVNEFERFQEDDEPSTLTGMATRALQWLEESVESP